MSEKSEVRDGMRIDWDVADHDGGRPRPARRRLPPGRGGPLPGASSPTGRTRRASPSRTATRAPGSAWSRSIPTSPTARAISTRAGRWWTRRSGCRTATRACAWIRAAPGARPGYIDHFSPRETKDFYNCIEWAGVQPWSNGKVGLNGISYYGMNQWHVATLQPPHLAAMCIWEGSADWYRDMTHHGGILSTFFANWYDMQVKTVQHGLGERGPRSRGDGRAGMRRRDAFRQGAREEPLRFRRRHPRAPARRSVPPRPLPGLGEGRHAVPLGGQLGRTGAAPARQLRGLRARRGEGEMAGSARHRALDALLHRLRAAPPAALLRLFPEGREERLGPPAESAAPGAPRRPLRRAPRERVADRAHAVDEVLPRSGGAHAWSARRRMRPAASRTMRRATASTFLSAPLDRGDRDHGPLAARLFVSSSTARRGSLSRRSACSRRTCGK